MTTIGTEVNRPFLPPGGATVTAEVEVEPGHKSGDVRRQILLVIDTSGSMEGEKLDQARIGAGWVFGLLEPEDHVGIVEFETEPREVMGMTRWGQTTRKAALEHVDRMAAGGGTDLYGGLETALDVFESLAVGEDDESGGDSDGTKTVRRVLLLSDGKDNKHFLEDIAALARDLDALGARIQAAGIGDDYSEDTIRTLGTSARGEWTHLEVPGDIEEFFGDAVERAAAVVATDVALELSVPEGVEVDQVYRALPQAQEVDLAWDGNRAVVPLPDLTRHERQRVVLKCSAPGGPVGSEGTLADVALVAGEERAMDHVAVEYTDDPDLLATHNEAVSLDHRETVIRTALGRGDVAAAETELARMTAVHGAETRVVRDVERETQLVKEGGRAERNRATKIVTDEDRIR